MDNVPGRISDDYDKLMMDPKLNLPCNIKLAVADEFRLDDFYRLQSRPEAARVFTFSSYINERIKPMSSDPQSYSKYIPVVFSSDSNSITGSIVKMPEFPSKSIENHFPYLGVHTEHTIVVRSYNEYNRRNYLTNEEIVFIRIKSQGVDKNNTSVGIPQYSPWLFYRNTTHLSIRTIVENLVQ